MQIKLDKKFEDEFFKIFKYIAKDKYSAAKKFKKELFSNIKNIPNFPYKHRKSIYFDDENTRDMIFKKYTIIYRIKKDFSSVEIIRIFNQNHPFTQLKIEKLFS